MKREEKDTQEKEEKWGILLFRGDAERVTSSGGRNKYGVIG